MNNLINEFNQCDVNLSMNNLRTLPIKRIVHSPIADFICFDFSSFVSMGLF